ncbi:MAG: hypothetical protein Q9187_000503 [Circinaria calcarea]
MVILENIWDIRNTVPSNTATYKHLQTKAQLMRLQAMAMQRSERDVPWWLHHSLAPDEMTYDCDAALGSPKAMDCSKLQNQIRSRAGNVQVGLGEVKYLSATIVLTWAQIQTALGTLLNFCTTGPLKPSRGGRAYFGPQPALSGRRRKRASGATGERKFPLLKIPNINVN